MSHGTNTPPIHKIAIAQPPQMTSIGLAGNGFQRQPEWTALLNRACLPLTRFVCPLKLLDLIWNALVPATAFPHAFVEYRLLAPLHPLLLLLSGKHPLPPGW